VPVQDLRELVQPDGGASKKGWSCKAIAYLFMECLALHGIKCMEVYIQTAPNTKSFLVHNWSVSPKPIPNWETHPDYYYAGSWVGSTKPPLHSPVSSSLSRVDKTGAANNIPVKIDLLKKAGVPGQGQPQAPLDFYNHWIVEVDGSLYDTSYGLKHANDLVAYAKKSLAGWLIGQLKDSYSERSLGVTRKRESRAWVATAISTHTLQRSNEASN
jgi:hypothetical protein